MAHFRQPHFLHAGARHVLDSHLPEVREALLAAGALRYSPLAVLPPSIGDRSLRAGDDRFETISARRPVIEYAFGSVAEKLVDIRRGVEVAELCSGTQAVPGVRHVSGVRTAVGERLDADLVIDATGRRSMLPRWLDALGARTPTEEAEDSGFIYYTRYFRSSAGAPEPRVDLLSPMGAFSLLTLPGDNGTWSVTVYISSRERALRQLRKPGPWGRVVAACPLHAHWLDGEPITGVLTMSGVLDRYRRFAVDGVPVATGVVAVGDAWACTNPSLGRGITLGLLHVAQLREVVRSHLGHPGELAGTWDAVTEAEQTP